MEFDRRVKAEFSVGSSEAELIHQLKAEGYLIGPRVNGVISAKIERGIIVKKLWSIRWRAKNGQLEEIWGVYGAIAP